MSLIASETIWNVWTYCSRLINYIFLDRSRGVYKITLEQTTFHLARDQNYPVTKYCTYCGCERFTDEEIHFLESQDVTFCDIENHPVIGHIVTTPVNPLICDNSNCLMGLYNLNNQNIIPYDINNIFITSNLKTTDPFKDILKINNNAILDE